MHSQPQATPISFGKDCLWLSATELGHINLTFPHEDFNKWKWKQLRENTDRQGKGQVLPAGPKGNI